MWVRRGLVTNSPVTERNGGQVERYRLDRGEERKIKSRNER
jgi:hypothetical protein